MGNLELDRTANMLPPASDSESHGRSQAVEAGGSVLLHAMHRLHLHF